MAPREEKNVHSLDLDPFGNNLVKIIEGGLNPPP